MIIDNLTLRNFRLFEDLSISFDDRLSVIVGVNGAGKSSVLDAMSILLSCYVGGFDDVGVQKIAQSDIRHVTHRSGSFFENVPQLPVEIGASGTICDSPVSWKSVKQKNSASSASPKAYDTMTQLATGHQDRLREGDGLLAPPLVAYYGTGRLWKQETSKRKRDNQLRTTFGRLTAYDDCLDAHLTDTMLASWFERMTYKSLQQGAMAPEFAAVQDAVASGLKNLTGLSDVALQSNLDLHELEITYTEDGEPKRMLSSRLSDGYRVALNLFADIAYRAAMLNPQLGDAVLEETEGIVLVDEVDLHLHPRWQQLVLMDLADIFPRMQFVVTTHAPAVISSVAQGQLIVMDGNSVYPTTSGFYGKDVNTILREVMGTDDRPRAVKDLFGRFYGLIDEGKYDEAEVVLGKLAELLGDSDPELAACNVQLDLERMDLS